MNLNLEQMLWKKSKIFGENCVNIRSIQWLFRKFAAGDESLKDNSQARQPYVINDEELHAAIEEDSSQMSEMLAQRFAINDKIIR